MKLNLKWDGLQFEDAVKGQKGEVRAASLDIEMSVEEMIEMAKNDRTLILGLLSLGKDYISSKKERGVITEPVKAESKSATETE